MNRIKTFLFAIVVMMGATGIMTACQEDAPVINYTMTVTVTNDFSKVVEAIENGFLKNEDAVNRLSEAIDKMNRDQAGKLQAVIDVLNAVNATLDTKLAAIEAAMQAQTLSLEGKLELIRAAIEALPDYSAKLEAITSAIEALPDYSDKLAALETAMQAQTLSLEGKLELIRTAIEALPDYTAKLEAITSAIEALPDYSEKIAALETAMQSQTLSLEGKLELIRTAIEALPDYTAKLEAITSAIEALPDYSDKLAAIEAALEAGFLDQKTALGGIRTALEALKTSMGDFSSDIDAIVNAIDGVAAALDDTNDALNGAVADALADIFNAIDGLTDYSEILAAIKTAIENIGGTEASNSLVIDGETTSFFRVGIDKSDLSEGKYDIYFTLDKDTPSSPSYVEIMAEKKYHDGVTVDLTKKEPEHTGWYWAVEYCNLGKRIFTAFAKPDVPYVVFQSGTLYVKRLSDNADGKPVFEIRLANGKIVDNYDGDGLEHTISLHYTGPLDLDEF